VFDSHPLNRLLHKAYEAFAQYPRPQVLHASPIRDPKKLLKQLTSKRLRLLDVEDVQEYASAALTTVGTAEDYKHFLPRLLDLAVESGVVEPQTIALKLNYADWRAWPKNEQQTLEDIFLRAGVDAFKQHTDDDLAARWLASLAILNIDLDRLRAEVITFNTDCCALQLADLLLSDTLFATDPFERAYWTYVPDQTVQETRSWLLSGETRRLLQTVRLRIRSKDTWLLNKAIAKQEELIQQRLH
jgi:hypothetical protein